MHETYINKKYLHGMFSFREFSGECSFCYRTVLLQPIALCSCSTEMCLHHLGMHSDPQHRMVEVSLTLDRDTEEKIRMKKGENYKEMEEYSGTCGAISILGEALREQNKGLETMLEVQDFGMEIDKNAALASITNNLVHPGAEKKKVKTCTHYEQAPQNAALFDGAEIKKKCRECDVSNNTWLCTMCGTTLCGRKQYGIEGNGHAMEHWKSCSRKLDRNKEAPEIQEKTKDQMQEYPSPHSVFVKIQTVCPRKKSADAFCYLCDEFVVSPQILECIQKICRNLQAAGDKGSAESISELEHRINWAQLEAPGNPENNGKNTQALPKTSPGGIVNAGNTCYISAVLLGMGAAVGHAVDRMDSPYGNGCIYSDCPRKCLGCQLQKVMRRVVGFQKKPKTTFAVDAFRETVEATYPRYVLGVQQDAAEFFEDLLGMIVSYDEIGHFSGFADIFRMRTVVQNTCTDCRKVQEMPEVATSMYVGAEEKVSDLFAEAEGPAECVCGGKKRRSSTRLSNAPQVITVVVKQEMAKNKNEESKEQNHEQKSRSIEREIECTTLTGQQIRYSLVSAVIYEGTANAGHYFLQLRPESAEPELTEEQKKDGEAKKEEQWITCNDEKIVHWPLQDSKAVLLFYRKCSAETSPN